jgi:hypothetical protein
MSIFSRRFLILFIVMFFVIAGPVGLGLRDAVAAPPLAPTLVSTLVHSPPDDSDDADDSNEDEDEDAEADEDEASADEESDSDAQPEDADDERSDESDEAASDDKDDKPSKKRLDVTDSTDKKEKSKPKAASKDEDKSNVPQVEVFIPSVTNLVEAGKSSRTGALVKAFSGMMPRIEKESDDDFDFDAIFSLLSRVADWPDTAIGVMTFTMDRDGRPRWAVKLDWNLDDTCDRIREMLEDEKAKKLLSEITLNKQDDGTYKLETPDVILAVVKSAEHGSLIISDAKLETPSKLFGEKLDKSGTRRAPTKNSMLVYCRLNMDAGKEDEKSQSILAGFSMVSDIRYGGKLTDDGLWSERFNVRWNPFLGLGIKQILKKTNASFSCPKNAYVTGAFHVAMADGLADTIAGLETGTIGSRADGEMAFAALPGTGFFPIPDVYYQFNARRTERISDDIREAIEDDTKERKEDDRPPAWHEAKLGDDVYFWKDSAADNGGGFSMATFRTVVFFESPEDDDDRHRLIIAETSTQPEDAIKRWQSLRRKSKENTQIPDSKNAHWQLVINWRKVYEWVQPYLTVLSATTRDTESAPTAEELGDTLCDSTINVKIEYAGLDVRHTGPIPIGAAGVPGVTVASLSATAGYTSEAAREQTACRNLRVLHHHAKLFKKDYGRWPATVAELDGYVDFSSHPNLLMLRPKDGGIVAGIVSVFTTNKRENRDITDDADEIDDDLYEIDWAETEWKLKFRPDEFVEFATIYIDQDGKIHRVAKKGDSESKEKNEDELAVR